MLSGRICVMIGVSSQVRVRVSIYISSGMKLGLELDFLEIYGKNFV